MISQALTLGQQLLEAIRELTAELRAAKRTRVHRICDDPDCLECNPRHG